MLHILSVPVHYALELTPFCDNRCFGCYNVFVEDKHARAENLPRPLTFEQWKVILDLIAPHAHRLKLSGGEPVLHPEFEKIVRYISALSISFTVFTNGRWHDPEKLIDVLLASPKFVGLLISLHGAHQTSHESFSGVNGSFDETIENIKLAVARGLPVTTSTVLTQANINELPDIIELSLKLGAHHVVFNRYLGQEIQGQSITETELHFAIQILEQVKASGKPVKFGVGIPQCFAPNSSKGCLAGVAYCAIDPWGNLRPCAHSHLVAGNLLTESLEQVWQSTVMQRFRDAIPNVCYSCTAFPSCHGGCKATAMELGRDGDPLMRQPLSNLQNVTLKSLRLGTQMRPVRKFDMKPEPFGYVLLRGNAVVPVRANALKILDTLDGAMTLAQIRDQFGDKALALVGVLYQHGLVELQV